MKSEGMITAIVQVGSSYVITIGGLPNTDTVMQVTKGYNFDDIHVDYEIITSEIITIPISDILFDYYHNLPINLYYYPHSGTFEWYDHKGTSVGTGVFEKSYIGPPYGGTLSATISDNKKNEKQFLVYGQYWVTSWAVSQYQIPLSPTQSITVSVKVPVTLDHSGSYNKLKP